MDLPQCVYLRDRLEGGKEEPVSGEQLGTGVRQSEGVVMGRSGMEECIGCAPEEEVELCVWVPRCGRESTRVFSFKSGHEVVPSKKQ